VNAAGLAAVIVAVAALVTAVTGLLALFRKQVQVVAQVREVHELVNHQLDRQLIYNQQLTAELTAAGVAVPEQELPPGAGEAGERKVAPG
jgi:uncharacterized iron-regulated membrane protein